MNRRFFTLARFFSISKSMINNIIGVPVLYDTVRFEVLTYSTNKLKAAKYDVIGNTITWNWNCQFR